MNKRIIRRIAKIMNLHGISAAEIEKERKLAEKEQRKENKNSQTFDLLVEGENGKKCRVAFEDRGDAKILGIFPFAYSNVYLDVDETEETFRRGADEDAIPSLSFWKSLEGVREKMNQELASLGLPIVEGCYFASTPYGFTDLNWIIGYVPKEERMRSDYYGSNEKARIRYNGMLE